MTAIIIPSWYVLHTKSRFENVVHEGLTKKSIEVFLPKVLVRSRRVDRKIMIRIPLFPGYLFVKSDLTPGRHIEIVKTAGVVRLVGNQGGPLPVSPETIESLKIMTAGDGKILTGTVFKKGDRVIVISGPLEGVMGTFARSGKIGRVIVNIEALGQFASVEVDEEDIEVLTQKLS
ncbi:MAG: UpxY family transcription antiterminator [Desulfobacterales bacterium]|nr:UpxY family transcription antiterminator [Desulfobacterales bacterium]